MKRLNIVSRVENHYFLYSKKFLIKILKTSTKKEIVRNLKKRRLCSTLVRKSEITNFKTNIINFRLKLYASVYMEVVYVLLWVL